MGEEETERQEASRYESYDDQKVCPGCGNFGLRRVVRRGFLQSKFFSIIGIFPWECSYCRNHFLIRKRGGKRI